MAGCSAIKQNGERCRGIATTGSDYCPAHDPARAEDRRKAASKAARARHDPEIRELKDLLKDLYAAVLEGRVDRAAAAVANQIANTRLRALEVERRVREQEELEERMDELEELLEEAERRSTYARR
jgi:DNA gyrase/topoisomerase IV subunit A